MPANVARDLANNGNTPAEAKTVTISNYISRPTVSIMLPTGAQHAPFEVIVEFSAAVTGFVQDELLRTGTAGTRISNWVADAGGARYTATLTPTHSGTLILTVASGAAMAGTAGNRSAAPVTVLILPEDVDRDGDVDIFDLFEVGLRFGQTIVGDPEEGNPDVNRDGAVDIMDFNMVEGRIGTSIGGAGAATPSSTRLTALRQDIRALGSSSAVPQNAIQTLEKHLTALAPTDTSPPGASISVPSGVQNGAFDATITFTEVVSSFEQTDLSLTGTANTTITAWTTTDNTTYTATITPTTSGSVTLRVPAGVATDAANNNNTASNTQTVSADVDPPGVSLSVPSGVQTGVFSVTITFSEVVSGFTQSDVSLSGTASATITSWTASSNTTYTATITPATSGEVMLSVPANVAIDGANNNNTASDTKTVIVDVDPPGVSVSVPSGVQTGAFSVTITFTEPVSGFAQSDVSLSGTASATITSWTASSSTAYTATITPTSSGEVMLRVPAGIATDAASNTNTASNTKTVIVDMDPPGVSVTVPSGVQTGAFSVTITFSEAVSGFAQSDVSLGGTASATITSWSASSDTTYAIRITPTTSGEVLLSVPANVAIDAANNNNTASETKTVIVDMDRPSASVSVPSGVQNGAFDATITFTEAVSGFTQSDVSLSGTASATITVWTTTDNTTYIATITPTSSGSVTFDVNAGVATDAANNQNTAATSQTVSVDIDRPTVTIGVPSGTQTGAFNASITFSETVSGFGQSDVSLTGSASSITGWSANSNNTVYTATITPTASGTVTIGVAANVATDAAGNNNTAATSKTVTVSVDTTSPGVSITVPSVVQNSAFNATITFTEAVSGFTQSDVSLSGSAASITGWRANSGNTVYTATITPTASGTVTIGVAANVATDAANNNNTASNTKTVIVDVDPPGVSLSVPSGVQTGVFSVTITFSEAVSGFAQSDVSLGGTASASITAWSANSDNTTFTAAITPTTSGEATVSVPANVAIDAANNNNTASNTKAVSVDMDRPSVSLSVPSGVQTGVFSVTITFSEVVSGFVQSDVSLSGTASATITSWTASSNTTYTATITPTSSGSVTLRVPANVATDAANNKNTASNTQTVSVDVDPPSVSVTVPSGVQTGVFSVTITFSEAVSGFAQSDVSLGGTASATITSWTASSNTTFIATITPATSGEVMLSVPANVATDAANNNNTASNTKAVTINIPPPTPDPATWMPDANLRAAVGTSLNLQPSETPTQAKMLHLTELKAAGRSISNITGIEYATNLTTARFAKNRISNISPLAGLTQLTRLRLQDNQVSSISSLSRLANLTELFLGNNQIADVTPLAGLVDLTTLRLAGNPFENSGANAEMLNTLRAAGVNIDIPAAVGAPAGERGAYPDETLLLPNYPNPFNPETWIPYQLAEDANVTLTIYDIRGAMVRQLDLGYQVPGYYINQESAAYWDGMDENGEPVAIGLYFYQLSTPSFRQIRRMVVLK